MEQMEQQKQRELSEGAPKKDTNDDYEVRKTKSRTLLTGKKEMRTSSRAGVRLDKIPEGTAVSALGKTALNSSTMQQDEA